MKEGAAHGGPYSEHETRLVQEEGYRDKFVDWI